ncbi:efflux RND transporter periplasmic adaptor subunit [Janthinobacterium sp. BJB303]|nr:efflux RND transporter periplasmic adaptor subunit [Janthinobacterium sp. BJB303]
MNRSSNTGVTRTRGQRYRLIAGIGTMLALLTVWALWPAQSSAPSSTPPIQVGVVVASPAEWIQTTRISGTLVARDEIAIGTALQDQRVVRVLVEMGDTVRQGQLLAELESTGLMAQVSQAEAALSSARATLRERRATHREAQASFQRIEPLGIGTVSAQQVDERRAQAESALASLQVARADIDQALARLAESRSQLGKTRVHAPADGLIVERGARAGALASGEPLFRLVRSGQLELEAEIAEGDLARVRQGTAAHVSVAGQPGPIAGHVRLVTPRIDPQSRLGKIRIVLADPHSELRTGAFALAQLELGRKSLAVALPSRSVTITDKGQASVMLVHDDGKVIRRQVTVAMCGTDLMEIRSGLKTGERVVATASAFLRDGDVVSIVDKKDDIL